MANTNHLMALVGRDFGCLVLPKFPAVSQILKANFLSRKLPEDDAEVYPSADAVWLNNLRAFIGEKAADPSLSVVEIVTFTDLSTRQFRRRLEACSGEGPAKFLRNFRLDMARDFLRCNHFRTVKETALAVGYRDPCCFSEQFQQRFGCLPSSVKQ